MDSNKSINQSSRWRDWRGIMAKCDRLAKWPKENFGEVIEKGQFQNH
jgi:hypothetical protein